MIRKSTSKKVSGKTFERIDRDNVSFHPFPHCNSIFIWHELPSVQTPLKIWLYTQLLVEFAISGWTQHFDNIKSSFDHLVCLRLLVCAVWQTQLWPHGNKLYVFRACSVTFSGFVHVPGPVSQLNVFKQCYSWDSGGRNRLHHKFAFFHAFAFYFSMILLSIPTVGDCVPSQIGYCCSQV